MEVGEEIVFLRRLERGGRRIASYGIQGGGGWLDSPPRVVARARELFWRNWREHIAEVERGWGAMAAPTDPPPRRWINNLPHSPSPSTPWWGRPP